METKILPMAVRRYRHSARRSSMAERTLQKMKNIESPMKAETGELVTHRLPKPLCGNNKVILAHSDNLSNDSVVTVKEPPA